MKGRERRRRERRAGGEYEECEEGNGRKGQPAAHRRRQRSHLPDTNVGFSCHYSLLKTHAFQIIIIIHNVTWYNWRRVSPEQIAAEHLRRQLKRAPTPAPT